MDKEKRRYLIIAITGAVLTVFAVVILFVQVQYEKSKQNSKDSSQGDNSQYTTTLEDGSRQNTSAKLKQDKKFDGLDITDIELIEQGNITQLTGLITNNTKKVKEECTANIILLDSRENEIAQMSIYIKELQPSESTRLNASATLDYSNAYNFVIKK